MTSKDPGQGEAGAPIDHRAGTASTVVLPRLRTLQEARLTSLIQEVAELLGLKDSSSIEAVVRDDREKASKLRKLLDFASNDAKQFLGDVLQELGPQIGASLETPEPTDASQPPLGEALRTARIQRKTGLRELARAAGVNASYLTDIEKGRRAPSARVLSRLSAVLDVDLAHLTAQPAVPTASGTEGRQVQVGELIRRERLRKDLGVRELGRQVGVAASYLTDIEKGRRAPSERVLTAIAGVLDLDLDYLMALSGRLSGETARYIERHPRAFALLRQIAEADLDDEALQRLSAALETGALLQPASSH